MEPMPIQNCNFDFECPVNFLELQETENAHTRFCEQCKENVYLCGNLEELQAHSQAGHCVSLVVRPSDTKSMKEGDVVQINSGFFENFQATICDVDPEKRLAAIHVHIFGRVLPFWVDADELDAVNQTDD